MVNIIGRRDEIVLSKKERPKKVKNPNVVFIVICLSPIWIIPIAFLSDYLDKKFSPPVVEKHYVYPRYEYPDDTVIKHPEKLLQKGQLIMPQVNSQNLNGHGIILTLPGNVQVNTNLSAEEILEQLELDYQDLYDYYGGADELY